ncbi:MAG: c-type cytochrome [Gammaproteobacteria bacterium]|nr:c-type cytochrome [Gammaproteobacteria bacterium]
MFKHFYSISLILMLLGPGLAQASDPSLGAVTYQRHCAQCHGVNGSPTMAGATDFKRGRGTMQSDQSLLARIQKGKNACPAYFGILSEQQILDVIAHIRTLF